MIVGREKQLVKAEEYVRQSLRTSRSWHMAIFGPRGCGRSAFLQELARRAELLGACPLYGEVEAPSVDAIMAVLSPEIERRLGASLSQYVHKNADSPLVLAELATRMRDEGKKGLLILLDLGRALDVRHRSEDIRNVATWLRVLVNWLVNNPSPLILAVGCTPLVLEEDRIAREAADVFRDRLSGRIWLGNDFDQGAFEAFREIARQRTGVEFPEADALNRLGTLTVGKLLELLEGVPKGPLTLQDLWKMLTESVPPLIPFPPVGKTIPRDLVPKLDWPSLVLTGKGIPVDPGLRKLVTQGVLRETTGGSLIPGKELSSALGFTPPEYEPSVRERALIRLQDPEDPRLGHDVLEGLRRLAEPYVENRGTVQMWTARTGKLVLNLASSLPSLEIPGDLLPRPLHLLLLLETPRAQVFDEMALLFEQGEWFAVLRNKELSALREEPGMRSKKEKETDFYNLYPRLEVELQGEEAVALLTAGEGAEPDTERGGQLLERLLAGPIAQMQKSRPFLPIASTANNRLLGVLIEQARPLTLAELASAAGVKESKAKDYLKALQAAAVLPRSRKGTFEWSPHQDSLLACFLEGGKEDVVARLQGKFTLPAAARKDPSDAVAAFYRPLTRSLDGDVLSSAMREWVVKSLRLRLEALVAAMDQVAGAAVGDMRKSVTELRNRVETWKARHAFDGGELQGDAAREALDELGPLEDATIQLAAERESKLKNLVTQAREQNKVLRDSLGQFRSAHPNARLEEVERRQSEVEAALGKAMPPVDSLIETLTGLLREVETERKRGSTLKQRIQTLKTRTDKAVKSSASDAKKVRTLRDAADQQIASGNWDSAEDSLKQLEQVLKDAEAAMTLEEMLPVAPPSSQPNRSVTKPPVSGADEPATTKPIEMVRETPNPLTLPGNSTQRPGPEETPSVEVGAGKTPPIEQPKIEKKKQATVPANVDEASGATPESEPEPVSIQLSGNNLDELADLVYGQGLEVVACKIEVEATSP